jgi:hypothetical protein
MMTIPITSHREVDWSDVGLELVKLSKNSLHLVVVLVLSTKFSKNEYIYGWYLASVYEKM